MYYCLFHHFFGVFPTSSMILINFLSIDIFFLDVCPIILVFPKIFVKSNHGYFDPWLHLRGPKE